MAWTHTNFDHVPIGGAIQATAMYEFCRALKQRVDELKIINQFFTGDNTDFFVNGGGTSQQPSVNQLFGLVKHNETNGFQANFELIQDAVVQLIPEFTTEYDGDVLWNKTTMEADIGLGPFPTTPKIWKQDDWTRIQKALDRMTYVRFLDGLADDEDFNVGDIYFSGIVIGGFPLFDDPTAQEAWEQRANTRYLNSTASGPYLSMSKQEPPPTYACFSSTPCSFSTKIYGFNCTVTSAKLYLDEGVTEPVSAESTTLTYKVGSLSQTLDPKNPLAYPNKTVDVTSLVTPSQNTGIVFDWYDLPPGNPMGEGLPGGRTYYVQLHLYYGTTDYRFDLSGILSDQT